MTYCVVLDLLLSSVTQLCRKVVLLKQ